MTRCGRWTPCLAWLALFLSSFHARAENAVGARGTVGCRENPKHVTRLQISEPGIYENYLVDSDWAGGNRIKITADNEVCFRLRGPTGRGDALVTINNCAAFDSRVGVRMEDRIRDLRIRNLSFGEGIERKYRMVGRGPFPGYDNQDESRAESFESILKHGWE